MYSKKTNNVIKKIKKTFWSDRNKKHNNLIFLFYGVPV